jgi:hypothetical protein
VNDLLFWAVVLLVVLVLTQCEGEVHSLLATF